MADKEEMERRIYVLPKEMLTRLRAYQAAQGITSEVEAVRRLLDSALQMRDTEVDILLKLKSRFMHERDLRVLTREVLASHALVTQIILEDTSVTFRIRSGIFGKIDTRGRIFSGDDVEYMQEIKDTTKHVTAVQPSWEPTKESLDDDIPF
jgi:hypothetical protein